MKGFFERDKRFVLIGFVFLIIALLGAGVQVYFAWQKAGKTAQLIFNAENSPDENYKNWDSTEIRNLYKNINWIENQLSLAKIDSISLGINLTDSVVQVQLKGTALFQAKILEHYPGNYLENLTSENYYALFGKIYKIENEKASIPKKPIVKTKPGIQADSIKSNAVAKPENNPAFFWEFDVSNYTKVVVFSASVNDSAGVQLNKKSDITRYNLHAAFGKQEIYKPTLFLWINQNEARAIYRALPNNAQLVFRN